MDSWSAFFEQEQKEEYFIKLMQKVDEAYEKEVVYPPKNEMFSCFELTPYDKVKVVIIGQDPYHGKNQAHGLCFSVRPEVAIPPSLKNIYKELKSDTGINPPNHGYLVSWAKQGVLMMNTSWSVAEGNPASHKKFGWDKFTKCVLEVLNDYDKPLVFILWGNHAIEAARGITNPKHLLLKSPHPSPLAGGGFFGTKPFSKTNEFLKSVGRGEIDWKIVEIDHLSTAEDKKLSSITKAKIDENGHFGKAINVIDLMGVKTLWVQGYQSRAINVIDLMGVKTLIVLEKNRFLFFNPYTFAEINKPITLTTKENIKVEQTKMVKIDSGWHILCLMRDESKESKWSYCVAICDLQTGQVNALQKTKAKVCGLGLFEIENETFCFVAYTLNPTLILKFNLSTYKEEARFEIPQSSEVNFHMFQSGNKPMLLVEYIVGEQNQYKLFEAKTKMD